MSFDALLKAVPGSPPWVVAILLAVVAILLVERIVGITTSFTARRSDQQLLDQADKAVSILDKLPQNHSSRSELLIYISQGPIAELAARQKLRNNRKLESTKRHRSNALAAAIVSLIILVLFLPIFVSTGIESAEAQGVVGFYLYFGIFLGIIFLAAPFMLIALTFYGLFELVDLIQRFMGKASIRFKNWVVQNVQKKRGRRDADKAARDELSKP